MMSDVSISRGENAWTASLFLVYTNDHHQTVLGIGVIACVLLSFHIFLGDGELDLAFSLC